MSARHAGISLAALAALLVSSVTLAAEPVGGGFYSGHLNEPRDAVKVRFRVSRDGTRVTKIRLSDMPSYCRSGGPRHPIRFKPTAVTRMDTFSSTAVKRFASGPRKGKMQVRVKITGRFISKEVVRGRVTTNWTAAPDPDLCDGGDGFMAGMDR